MCRKLFLLVLVLGFVSTASAGPTWIGTVSRTWDTGGNWSLGAIPGTGDSPYVGWHNTSSVPFTPLISTETIDVVKLNVGGTDATGYLEMTGGALTVGASGFYMANSSRGDNPTMDMSGGVFTVTGADWRVGRRTVGTFNMTGGTLDVVKFKPGARTHDTAFGLWPAVTQVNLINGLVLADAAGIEESIVDLREATMIFDSTAGVSPATEIDAEVDYALARGWLRAYGNVSGKTVGGVEFLVIKSWNAFGDKLTLTAVPEPATIALLGLGGLALLRKKR